MIVLNTAVADQLARFKKKTDALIEKGVKKDEAIFQVLREYIIDSKPVRFEKNGYSAEWKAEAEARGLSGEADCVPALRAYISGKSKELLVGNGVLTEKELLARFEIKNEIYLKKLQIESRVLGDLALNHIIPTAITYQNRLLENVAGLKAVMKDYETAAEVQVETIQAISHHIREIQTMVTRMTEARKAANNSCPDLVERAAVYTREVRPYLEQIRYHVDKLELLVDDEIWPLPKYRELLFSR
jgi:glutamine synthetase